jgi:hypothetical protein
VIVNHLVSLEVVDAPRSKTVPRAGCAQRRFGLAHFGCVPRAVATQCPEAVVLVSECRSGASGDQRCERVKRADNSVAGHMRDDDRSSDSRGRQQSPEGTFVAAPTLDGKCVVRERRLQQRQ